MLKGKNVLDICEIINKCTIDEISKYLINEGKKRLFQTSQLDSSL